MTNEHKTILPALPDLSTENWSGVFHTAFRHAGYSQHAAQAHAAIERMDDAEWGNIVDYMLHGIRAFLAARPEPCSPVPITGLGSMTDEDNGLVSLRFKDEDAAQVFMREYRPTVDCRDMPEWPVEAEAQAQQPVASGEKDYCANSTTGECSCRKFMSNPSDCENGIAQAAPAPDAGARDAEQGAVEAVPNELNYWKGIAGDQAELLATLTAPDAGARDDEIDGQELHEILANMAEAVLGNGGHYPTLRAKLVEHIRALKAAPDKPAQDLVAAIKAMRCLNPFVEDNCRLYNAGFLAARSKAAALVAAHLKGTP